MKLAPVSFFLPLRKGSERVINKNTKLFAGIEGGILALKLGQLLATKNIDEIILSTNDEVCIAVAELFMAKDSRLKIIQRPDHLCQSDTKLTDLITYVPTIVNTDHIIWGHATTPIANGPDYDEGVKTYFDGLGQGYDSLVSVMPFQNFLLNQTGQVINNNSTKLRWPRTQDLLPLYEINHVMFIASRDIYINLNDRLGNHPFLMEMNKLQSLDVDWEEDFLIAEAVYERIARV
jgi:CMP-N-acetylneuraminic acid synthetase